ncbi:expressed unknown protein [Seminavis robusta]|uniref:CRAL-TRIO domain-containing protein n=1 Tax=Seminavis robusta TaxID=568900 RepID=A0A9N8HR12_9STRA|nr:expressed unknown protein [Seminavis robusta]|eukprot:Sro1510_g278590.1 n/a (305) ;mRNA; r:4562-5476
MKAARVARTVTPVVITPGASERSWRGTFLSSVDNNHNDDDSTSSSLDESVEEMMTFAERKRFLTANNGNEEKAMAQLQAYLEARDEFQGTQLQLEVSYQSLIDSHGRDYYDWVIASETAKEAYNEDKSSAMLPRIMRTHIMEDGKEACDLEGHRILHVLPAQIDPALFSLKTYALAIALYLDRKVSRESVETLTVLLDVRGGAGWANPKAFNLMPFIEETCSILISMFPERMHKTIIYPLPYALTWTLQSIVSSVLDAKTVQKLAILSGQTGVDAPMPRQKLFLHVDEKVALICERERLEAFTI